MVPVPEEGHCPCLEPEEGDPEEIPKPGISVVTEGPASAKESSPTTHG